jgi:hypothetical protein
MGDYTKKGVKIGTCGNAYYATLPMLLKERYTGDSEIDYYCDPKNKCSFAFPFPLYDGKRIGEISGFHDSIDCFVDLPESIESLHTDIVHHVHPKGGAGINLFIPCPFDKEKGSRHSRNLDKSKMTFKIVGQSYGCGDLAVVVECIYCKQSQMLTKQEAIMACDNLLAQAEKDLMWSKREKNLHPDCANWEHHLRESNFKTEVAKRIIETYQ